MGAFGAGNFENDDAGDWLGELTESEDLSLVRETLAEVARSGVRQVEAPACSRALAAAEAVAAINLHQPADLPDAVVQRSPASWSSKRSACGAGAACCRTRGTVIGVVGPLDRGRSGRPFGLDGEAGGVARAAWAPDCAVRQGRGTTRSIAATKSTCKPAMSLAYQQETLSGSVWHCMCRPACFKRLVYSAYFPELIRRPEDLAVEPAARPIPGGAEVLRPGSRLTGSGFG